MPAPTTRAWTWVDMRGASAGLERFRKERLRVELLLFEVRIEDHGEVADKNTAQPGGADLVSIHQHEPIFPRRFHAFEFRSEIFVEGDAELAGDFVFHDNRVAKQAADDFATEDVVVREVVAAHGGDAALVHGFFSGGDIAEVLGVGSLNSADGGDAHSVEIGTGFGGVTLEIAIQGAIAL